LRLLLGRRLHNETGGVVTDEAWIVHGNVAEVLDGDTVKVDLDLGWLIQLRAEPIRLLGINAPEKNTDLGKAAKVALERLLPVGARVEVQSRRWGGEREKYGRALARVFVAGTDVGQAMVTGGHAKPWDGKGERPK
jgi:endonuclease YncB( thermonuclease family)